MTYQDIWCNGWLLKKGTRECEKRYDIIKSHCDKIGLNNLSSVCDIGANMLYFSLRLNHDFGCNVIAFEPNNYQLRERHLKQTLCKDVMVCNRRLSLQDINILGKIKKFDLVLFLSVLHHVRENKLDWLKSLSRLGECVIVEFALQDARRHEFIAEYIDHIESSGEIIGYGKSHIQSEIKRPIVVLNNQGGE